MPAGKNQPPCWNGRSSTDRLVCNPCLDGKTCQNATSAGTFLGNRIWTNTTNLPIGANQDFSMEFVIRQPSGWFNTGNDIPHVIGIATGNASGITGNPCGALIVNSEGDDCEFNIYFNGVASRLSTSKVNGRGLTEDKWHSVAINFDRDGFMEAYLDGKRFEGAPVDISAQAGLDISAFGSYPLTFTDIDTSQSDAVSGLPAGLACAYINLGKYVVHKRLLTLAEIVENAQDGEPGLYPQTLVYYGPHQFLEADPNFAPIAPIDQGFNDALPVCATWLIDSTPSDSTDLLTWLASGCINEAMALRDLSGNGKHYSTYGCENYPSSPLSVRSDVAATLSGPASNKAPIGWGAA